MQKIQHTLQVGGSRVRSEQVRGISFNTAIIQLQWRYYIINI